MAYANIEDARRNKREWAKRNPDKIKQYQKTYKSKKVGGASMFVLGPFSLINAEVGAKEGYVRETQGYDIESNKDIIRIDIATKTKQFNISFETGGDEGTRKIALKPLRNKMRAERIRPSQLIKLPAIEGKCKFYSIYLLRFKKVDKWNLK